MESQVTQIVGPTRGRGGSRRGRKKKTLAMPVPINGLYRVDRNMSQFEAQHQRMANLGNLPSQPIQQMQYPEASLINTLASSYAVPHFPESLGSLAHSTGRKVKPKLQRYSRNESLTNSQATFQRRNVDPHKLQDLQK